MATIKQPYPGTYDYYQTTSSTTSVATLSTFSGGMTYYPDRYGYGASGGAGGGSFISDRELYYREMAQRLQEEVAHLKRMMVPDFYSIDGGLRLPSPVPKEPDNITWLRQRVEEITKAGRLAA